MMFALALFNFKPHFTLWVYVHKYKAEFTVNVGK